MKQEPLIRRTVCYAVGMFILAVGLTLTAQSGLGTSPLTSIAFVLGQIVGIAFSDATLIMFSLFVAVQIALEKRKTAANVVRLLLQIPLSILFTRVMGLVQRLVDLTGESVIVRLAVLLAAIVLTGVGAAMTLQANLVPNPGDGIVKALAVHVDRPLGQTKNDFDIINVAVAAALSFACLGRLTGVGIGSVIAMLGVGRVIACYNKAFGGQ